MPYSSTENVEWQSCNSADVIESYRFIFYKSYMELHSYIELYSTINYQKIN